jgi:uncharacterized damage-inducible protein DinB
MKQTKWFDRQFPIIQDNGLLPSIIERLEGTPARLTEKINQIDFTKMSIPTDHWSIKKEIGHLLDIEPLWLKRATQIVDNNPKMEPADLRNRKTTEANHDERDASDLVSEFKTNRQLLVDLLRHLSDEDLEKASTHPRLGTPMKIIDLAYFVAEHDDHHLAKITAMAKKN